MTYFFFLNAISFRISNITLQLRAVLLRSGVRVQAYSMGFVKYKKKKQNTHYLFININFFFDFKTCGCMFKELKDKFLVILKFLLSIIIIYFVAHSICNACDHFQKKSKTAVVCVLVCIHINLLGKPVAVVAITNKRLDWTER